MTIVHVSIYLEILTKQITTASPLLGNINIGHPPGKTSSANVRRKIVTHGSLSQNGAGQIVPTGMSNFIRRGYCTHPTSIFLARDSG